MTVSSGEVAENVATAEKIARETHGLSSNAMVAPDLPALRRDSAVAA
jgi:hypothetical protein